MGIQSTVKIYEKIMEILKKEYQITQNIYFIIWNDKIIQISINKEKF